MMNVAPSHVLPQDRRPHSLQRILPKMANGGQGGVTYFAVRRETYGMPAPGTKCECCLVPITTVAELTTDMDQNLR